MRWLSASVFAPDMQHEDRCNEQ